MKKIQMKICCISNTTEAKMAIAAGANAIGLVGNMPSGPGVISDDEIAHIASQTPPTIDTFLLTSETTVEGIVGHAKRTNTKTVQIVDKIPVGTHAKIKSFLPDVKIIQVIHVVDEWAMDEAAALMHHVDALLLDSGNPNAAIKKLGGTGKTHNWDISRKIVELSNVPVWLAGGLKTENVREAIDRVQPFGVDLCSGVRTNNHLDPQKLATFFSQIP